MSVGHLLDNADAAMINIFEYVKEKTVDIPSLIHYAVMGKPHLCRFANRLRRLSISVSFIDKNEDASNSE